VSEPDDRERIRPMAGPEPVGPTPDTGAFEKRFADRPLGYPSALVWLRAGILRDWRGALGAFVATWFYVPLALLAAVWGGVILGLAGLFAGGFRATDQVPAELRDAPLVGPLVEAFLTRSGGLSGGFLAFVLGCLLGLLAVLVLPWRDAFDEPANLVTGLAGVVLAAAFVGLVYTLLRVVLEPWFLAVSGARRLSRREEARLRPILEDCARRLDLPNLPRLLIEDDPVLTNARAYARHLVVSTAVLAEPDENIAALFSHELVHWRTGDEVTSAFIRGVGLPLVLVHAVPSWLMRRFPHPATDFLVFLVFWPVLVTMRFLVLPCHRRDIRVAEYRADEGALLAGHGEGMRALLEHRRSFETGRSGWDEAVCATHPPAELRLDRLAGLAEEAGSEVGEGAGAPRRVDHLFRVPGPVGSRRTGLVVVALVVASCLGGGLLTVVQWAFFRPEAAVADYFSALGDHDGRAALRLLTADQRGQVSDVDRLARIIEAKDYQPPTDVRVTSVERQDEAATAKVSFVLAGRRGTAELPLRRDDEATLGLFHRWRIDVGPASLALPAGRSGRTVNGVPVVGGPEGGWVALLPGAYTVAGPANPLSRTLPQVVLAVPGQAEVAGADLVRPSLAPGAQAAAEESVRAWLDGCAAQRVAAPAGCPFRRYGEVKRISWKITSYPRLQVELVDGGDGTTAKVSTVDDSEGAARATGTESDYFTGTRAFDDDVSFDVWGTVTVTDGTLTFRPSGE
jgi:Zn-dependent protease with chaperone function